MSIFNKMVLITAFSSSLVFANPAFMGGLTFKFGGNSGNAMQNAGATLKVLSSDEDKKPVIAAGVSYFPWAQKGKKYGLDIGAGYNMKNTTITGGWDFIQNQPSVSLGYMQGVSDSDDDSNAAKSTTTDTQTTTTCSGE